MVKLIRKKGKKVSFRSKPMKELMIKKVEKKLLKKEQEINEREDRLTQLAGYLQKINNIDLNKFNLEEIKQLSLKSEGFMKNLLENHVNNIEKEEVYTNIIKEHEKNTRQLKNKIRILENKNESLLKEVDKALKLLE